MSTAARSHAERNHHPHATGNQRVASASVHLWWLAAGLGLGFLVPYLFADLLALPRDLYYAVYSAFAIGLFLAWARSTGQSLGEMLRRRWALAIALGIAFATVMTLAVLAEPAGPRPQGLKLAWALIWRGIVYGFADGLLLSSFPILVVFAAFASTRMRERTSGKLLIGAVALGASVAMTAVYHLGYEDFRSAKVYKPMMGDLAWSIPTLVTLNPIGAPITHAGLHVTAVLHNPETDLFLPPHGKGMGERRLLRLAARKGMGGRRLLRPAARDVRHRAASDALPTPEHDSTDEPRPSRRRATPEKINFGPLDIWTVL